MPSSTAGLNCFIVAQSEDFEHFDLGVCVTHRSKEGRAQADVELCKLSCGMQLTPSRCCLWQFWMMPPSSSCLYGVKVMRASGRRVLLLLPLLQQSSPVHFLQ